MTHRFAFVLQTLPKVDLHVFRGRGGVVMCLWFCVLMCLCVRLMCVRSGGRSGRMWHKENTLLIASRHAHALKSLQALQTPHLA